MDGPRVRLFFAFFLTLIFNGEFALAEICAANIEGLDRTPLLMSLKVLFPTPSHKTGLLNDTDGTYLLLENRNSKLFVTLFTSGPFDIYPIRRESPLEFCDDGKRLRLKGLSRDLEFQWIEAEKFKLGAGGPRYIFGRRPMPALLRRLHNWTNSEVDTFERVPAETRREEPGNHR